MSESPSVALALPRPGRTLKVVLGLMFGLGVYNGFDAAWRGGGGLAFRALAFDPAKLLLGQVWRPVTAGLLTTPANYWHLLTSMLWLYFLAPDLERRWGGRRLVLFLASAVMAGNLAVLVVDLAAPTSAAWERFHLPFAYGPAAAIAAVAVAWGREHPHATLWPIPIRGAWMLWIVLGFCALDFIYPQAAPEGVVAPLGGVSIGLLLGGTPSMLRSLWLRMRLAVLRRRAANIGIEEMLGDRPKRRPRSAAPPLRLLSGGLDEVLKKRTPPKDKRYLN